MQTRAARVLAGLGLATLAVAVVALVAVWRLGGGPVVREFLLTGEVREMEPAQFQSAPLRTAQGGRDLVYLLSTQSETVTSRSRRGSGSRRREYLHVDLWAVDPIALQVAWRRRVRSFSGRDRPGRDLRAFSILGADGDVLWLGVNGPRGVALADGHDIADGALLDRHNPQFAGRRVDEPGFIAFGRHGLQLTLDDASQWRVDAATLQAAPRDTPLPDPTRVTPPAMTGHGSATAFRLRGARIGDRWLGVLTDREADFYGRPPVVPGRGPDEQAGVMFDHLESQHVPPRLVETEAVPYRLWSARVTEVSAAPRGWPAHMPDNWGTRPRYSDYAVLPDAPTFLRAGLLREHPLAEHPLWYRAPDSILVIHVDRLGAAGRLQLSRIAGPSGTPVWQAPLPFDRLDAVLRGDRDLVLLGTVPPAPGATPGPDAGPAHRALAAIDIASGRTRVLDLGAESLRR